jgi:hypothetical protein
MLAAHNTMVRYPAQSDLSGGQVMDLGDSINAVHCFEVRVFPVAFTIILVEVKANTFNGHRFWH